MTHLRQNWRSTSRQCQPQRCRSIHSCCMVSAARHLRLPNHHVRKLLLTASIRA